MLLEIVTSFGFVIPPQEASRIKPGNLYVRRTSYGTEFVRKREQHREEMHRPRRIIPQRRCTTLSKEELRIMETKQRLQEQLATIARAKARLDMAHHERRLSHSSTELREPRQAQQPESCGRGRTERRRSYEIQISTPDLYCTEYQNRHHHPHRTSCHDTHVDVTYCSSESPRREYCVRNNSPEIPRYCGRRSSWERSRPQQHHEEVPHVCERFVNNNERRRSVAGSCYRRGSRQFHSEEGYDCEIRAPEDYWLDDY